MAPTGLRACPCPSPGCRVREALTACLRPCCRGQLRTLPTPAQVEQLYGRMPRFLERALLPFQREGVLFGLAHGGRCLIAVSRGRRRGWCVGWWGGGGGA